MTDEIGTPDEDLPAWLFERDDGADDALFYREPRLVTHIDDATIGALTDFYRERIAPGARVLDLMSSWVSHLPAEVTFAKVAGHGMNASELAANARLDERHVQNLNQDPRLPWPDEAFDAVTIAVSVQYLVDPVAVFRELGRLLAPGGELIVASSHRCFPTKAVRAFRALPPSDRMRLYGECMRRAGAFEAIEFHDRSPPEGPEGQADPLWILTARRT
ncbi:MAG: methyltransferase domain-containing protein [Pseudomonadales bacterium]|nr:methyltransferase domain-containing protein [Pseudomonadales bacterium]